MSVMVTGSRGQLGSELCRRFAQRAVGLSRLELDITDRQAIEARFGALRPDVVINAAAYTAVDRAETDAAACEAVNALAVGYLADACRRFDAQLVHFSTDYVFGADATRSTPYCELDPPGPQSVYARSKLAGEQLAASCPRHLIVRTCGLYGRRPPGSSPGSRSGNFVDTMLRLAGKQDVVRVVDDQQCTPSYVPDVAAAIEFLIETQAAGLYHVVNGGSTTWHDFAAEIFREAGIEARLEPISTAQYAAPAPRPAYSVLDTSKYHALRGPRMPAWREALARCLAESPV